MFVWAGNQYNSMHQSDALRCFLKFPLELFSILHPQGILGVDRTTQLYSLRLLCFAQLSIFSPLSICIILYCIFVHTCAGFCLHWSVVVLSDQ